MDVKSLCLGILTLGESTGYEIKKHFEEEFSHFFPASYGSIYPALAQLARDEQVSVTNVVQERRPDKKVYAITALGRELLSVALAETEPSHRVRSELVVLLYFANLCEPQLLAKKLQRRLDDIDDTLEAVEHFEQGPHPSNPRDMVAGFARATLSAQRDYLSEHLSDFIASLNTQPNDAANKQTPGSRS